MAQIVADGSQFGTSGQCMSGMGVPHPVWTCPAKLFGNLRRLRLNGIRGCYEKSLGDIPKPGRSDTVLTAPCLQVSNERGGWLPHGWCGWHTALHQVVIQRHPGQRGQGHFASLAALADQLEPRVSLGSPRFQCNK